jgi:putative NADH-flavin reductase
MHIALFGATGRTGQLLLRDALQAGHTVTALVRDPSWAAVQDSSLTVLQGSIHDAAQVEQTITGADAVISVLGPIQNKPVYEISTATNGIITAMRRCGVRRLVMTAGAGVLDANDAPGTFDNLMGALVLLTAGHVYEDMRQSVDAVRQSDLDWTVVRVPALTNAPRTGRIRVGYVGKGTGNRLGRADLAEFLLKQATSKGYLHQAPVVSN